MPRAGVFIYVMRVTDVRGVLKINGLLWIYMYIYIVHISLYPRPYIYIYIFKGFGTFQIVVVSYCHSDSVT